MSHVSRPRPCACKTISINLKTLGWFQGSSASYFCERATMLAHKSTSSTCGNNLQPISMCPTLRQTIPTMINHTPWDKQ
ncbi:hypothetical protein HanIR_Chr04g0152501 [Helianthus annuus]|nr:hypothetical protein HanIR_Chr04g0152501 [Helianthus annuus]